MRETLRVRVLVVLLAWALLAGLARAQDAIPAETLTRIKDATVFVRSTFVVPLGVMRLAGRPGRAPMSTTVTETVGLTGSGFVMGRDGDAVLVATNSHVIAVGKYEAREVVLVFRSGTPQEQSVRATVLGRDAERDLAILKATPSAPPAPLDVEHPPALQETLPVYIVGFPFGKLLATKKGNPEITLGRGSISSLRHDDAGKIVALQINGDLNPGNSGGPLVDGKGKLVGIAVAHLEATQIGLAIPGPQLHAMLMGRIGGTTTRQTSGTDGRATVGVTVNLIDPLRTINNVTLLLVKKAEVSGTPKADAAGKWSPAAANMMETPLDVKDARATGTVILPTDPGQSVAYLMQFRYVRGDGQTAYVAPVALLVAPPGRAAQPVPPGVATPAPGAGQATVVSQGNQPAVVSPGSQPPGSPQPQPDGTTITMVLPDSARVMPEMVWSADGRYCYALEAGGLLREIDVSDLTVRRQVNLGHPCWGMTVTRGGLVAFGVPDRVLLIDESTLQVKARWSLAGARAVTGSRASDVLALGFNRGLKLIDAQSGAVLSNYDAGALRGLAPQPPGGPVTLIDSPELIRMSPDGHQLFLTSWHMPFRFNIEKDKLTFAEGGAPARGGRERLEISARHVAVVDWMGSAGLAAAGLPAFQGTYIYSASNLSAPVAAVATGVNPTCLAVDEASGRIYGQGPQQQLMVFRRDGTFQAGYQLPGGSTRQLLAQPDGQGVMVLTDRSLSWVKLKPADRPAGEGEWMVMQAPTGPAVEQAPLPGTGRGGRSRGSVAPVTPQAQSRVEPGGGAAAGADQEMEEQGADAANAGLGPLKAARQFAAPGTIDQMQYAAKQGLLFLRHGAANLWVVDTAGGDRVLGKISAKNSLSGMSLSPGGGALFVADCGGEGIGAHPGTKPQYIHRFDLASRKWAVRTVPANAFRVQAVDDARFLLESQDQFITMTLNRWESDNNTITELAKAGPGTSGQMAYAPKSSRVIHGGAGSGFNDLSACEIKGDQLVKVAGFGMTGSAQRGGQSVTVATDGRYVYYGGLQIELWERTHDRRSFPEAIYAASANLAFGAQGFYRASSGGLAGRLGFTTSVYAISEDGRWLWAYDPQTQSLHLFEIGG